MTTKIEQLFTEGDSYLKDAKAMFFANADKHGDSSCYCCESVKKYIDAYEVFLFERVEPSNNFHVVMHTIAQKDINFKQFKEIIYEIKCFADEAKKEPDNFFLYDDEIDEVLKNILKVRKYIATKVQLGKEFMQEFSNNDFMAI